MKKNDKMQSAIPLPNYYIIYRYSKKYSQSANRSFLYVTHMAKSKVPLQQKLVIMSSNGRWKTELKPLHSSLRNEVPISS